MAISVRLLRANHGDCILVTHEGPERTFNLLIDGGNAATFQYGPRGRYSGHLRSTLDELKSKDQLIDLAILTHIDDDHIAGMLKAFEADGYLSNMVKSIWFNSSRTITNYFKVPNIPENEVYLRDPAPETSVKQGKELEALLGDIGCEQTPLVKAGQVINKGPFKFTILSPDEEKLRKLLCVWPTEVTSADTAGAATDYSLSFQDILAADKFEADTSIANGSSIAFIAEADGKAMLFLGDTHDETVLKTLSSMGYSATSKLSVELIKVSHHGSKYNTSPEFLSLINTKRYLISTDGSRHGLPDKRTIARILASSEQGIVLFNYGEVIKRMLLDGESDLYPGRLEALSEGISL